MNNMKGIVNNGNSVTRLHDSKITTEYPKKSIGTSFLKKIKRFINKLEHFSLQKTVKSKATQILKVVSVKTTPTLSLAPSLDSRVVTPPPPPPMPSVNSVITPPMVKFDCIAKGTASQPHGEGKIGMNAVILQLKEHAVFKKNAEKYQVTADEIMGSINTPLPPPMAKFAGIAKRIESQSHGDGKAGMDQVIAQLKEHPIFKLKESD